MPLQTLSVGLLVNRTRIFWLHGLAVFSPWHRKHGQVRSLGGACVGDSDLLQVSLSVFTCKMNGLTSISIFQL